MENYAISTMLAGHPFYAPRASTDKLFPLPHGSFDYRGYLDDAVRFVEDYQLLDSALWEKFVRVFAERPDGENGGWRGEYWGKMMRGGCITYQYTQNPELLTVLTKAVRDLLATADEKGRITSYDDAHAYTCWDIWCRKYVLLGLEHFFEICPDEALKADVLSALYAEAKDLLACIGEGEGKTPIQKATSAWRGVNSASVLEPIVRLYHLTGEQRFLDFATYIVNSGAAEGEHIFETALANEKKPSEYLVVKAYETISCFEGLIEYYRATGIEKWRTAAINLGQRIRESEVSLIGCCGCWHELFDNTAQRQFSTKNTGVMQETCVTVTWMKFCHQLLCLTGDAAFADEIERSAYNALLGSINFDKNTKNAGLPFDSYSPLMLGTRARETGGRQTLPGGGIYGCCACIGSAGTGLIPATSVLLREDGVAMCLYLAGTVAAFTPTGAPLEISVKTNYPADGTISLRLDTTDEQPFTLALRIPAWSRMTTLAVNGQLTDAHPGSFAEIKRVWKCGDVVELYLDMRAEVLRPSGNLPDEYSPYHVALRRGPLVLARDARLPGDINAPVFLYTDPEGYAAVEPCEPQDVPAFQTLRAKQTDGTYLYLIDYASAGRTWDERSLMCAWMPTKSYPALDFERPFVIMEGSKASLNVPANTNEAPLCILDGVVCSDPEHPNPFVARFADRKENSYRIKVGDQYLAVDDEDRLILTDRRGGRFTPRHLGMNRYALAVPDGRLLRFSGSPTKAKPIELAESREIIWKNTFTFYNVEDEQ